MEQRRKWVHHQEHPCVRADGAAAVLQALVSMNLRPAPAARVAPLRLSIFFGTEMRVGKITHVSEYVTRIPPTGVVWALVVCKSSYGAGSAAARHSGPSAPDCAALLASFLVTIASLQAVQLLPPVVVLLQLHAGDW